MSEATDWSLLPLGYRQYIPQFELYGDFQFEDRVFDYLEHMDYSEKTNLLIFYKCMLPIADNIHAWLEPYSLSDHKCMALVYFALCFLATAHDGGFVVEQN